MEEGDGIPNYYSRVEFTPEKFKELFLAKHPEARLTGDASGWLTNFVMDNLSVKTVDVGGVTVRGTEPVSYTHLDVYKRQGLYAWGGGTLFGDTEGRGEEL